MLKDHPLDIVRTVALLNTITLDGRIVTEVRLPNPARVPVFAHSPRLGIPEVIGSAEISIDGDSVVARYRLAHQHPDGTPVLAITDGEPVPGIVNGAVAFVQITGKAAAVFYDTRPAWPVLAQNHMALLALEWADQPDTGDTQ